jgi:hypothetical protein
MVTRGSTPWVLLSTVAFGALKGCLPASPGKAANASPTVDTSAQLARLIMALAARSASWGTDQAKRIAWAIVSCCHLQLGHWATAPTGPRSAQRRRAYAQEMLRGLALDDPDEQEELMLSVAAAGGGRTTCKEKRSSCMLRSTAPTIPTS